MKKILRAYSNRGLSLLLAISVLLTVFSSVLSLNIISALDSGIEIWQGDTAGEYAGGDGTASNPHQIATGAQLYKMISENYLAEASAPKKYFVLTADIYLNDVTDSDWVDNSPNHWFSSTANSYVFKGVLDGKGHTVHGLYLTSSEGNYNGLIPQLGEGSEVKNLQIKNANISGNYAGTIAGRAYGNSGTSVVKISGCTVDSSVVISAAHAGGLVGGNASKAVASALTISNCLVVSNNTITGTSYEGGLVGNSWKPVSILNSISVGIDAFGRSTHSSTVISGVYTNQSAVSVAAVQTVTDAEITGETAKTTLLGFNFVSVWKTTETYPALRYTDPDKVNAGEIWSGLAATKYAGGTGTSTDPYQIATGEQLYKMISENYLAEADAPQNYFVLTSDIYLNNVTDANWISNTPNHWFSSTASSYVFKGVLDGKGHVIHGLYLTSNTYNGLIPQLGEGAEVKNVQVENSNISGSYAGAIAGRAYGNTGTIPSKISNCSVDASVIINSNYAGGLVGGNASKSVASALTISNCLVISNNTITGATYIGGLVGNSWKPVSVTNSLSIGIDAFGRSTHSSTILSGVYTNQSTVSVAAVQTVTDTQITGQSAKDTLVGFDFDTIWEITDTYPVLCHPDPDNAKPGDKWSGMASSGFAGGTGTETDPYQIATGEQLRYMFENYVENEDNSSVYFLLTNDIDLNNKKWNVSYGQSAYFSSILDGDGHTISNLNAVGTTYSGLLHQLGNGAEVKNIVFNSPKSTASSNHAGVIAARVYSGEEAAKTAVISNCIIKNATVSATINAGGFVGVVAGNNKGTASLKIDNCGFNGTLTATNIGGLVATIQSYSYVGANCCYISGADAFSSNIKTTSITKCDYVYVTASEPVTASGIGAVSVVADGMKGELAKTNLVGFDFTNTWKTVENDYPMLTFKQGTNDNEEKEGDFWDGTKAAAFAGGTGTKDDPYLISNGAELRLMAESYIDDTDNSNIYFALTNDIHLNDISKENWTKSAYKWTDTRGQTVYFSSNFDGQGHTIYGLYIENGGSYVGLFHQLGNGANIHNLKLEAAHVSGTGNHAGVIASRVIAGASVDIKMCVLENCFVESKNNAAGFVATVAGGSAGISNLKVQNCGFSGIIKGVNTAGIASNTQNSSFVNASICYSAGADAFGFLTQGSLVNCNKVYTTDSTPVKDEGTSYGAKYVDDASVKGDAAKGALVGFDFVNVWQTKANGYPVIRADAKVVEKEGVWDGKAAQTYAGGSGTEKDPYKIESAAQLYKMVTEHMYDTDPNYFVLTNDIVINDTTNKDWVSDDPNMWVTGANSATKPCEFKSSLNGQGHYIYGLYTIGGFYNGLIPALSEGASVSNVHIRDSVIKSSSYAGAIAGRNSTGSAIIYGCSADETVTVVGKTAGGLVGGNAGTLTVEDSYFRGTVSGTEFTAGICADSWGVLNIKRSYTVGSVVFNSSKTSNTLENVYSETKQKNGVVILSEDKMKGNNAKVSMKGFGWDVSWRVVDNSYPELNIVIKKYNDGKKGEIWSGEIANRYAGGSGTKEDPYIIQTPEQLYFMVTQNCVPNDNGEYYRLTADIYLNDTSEASWTDKANKWFTATGSTMAFKGYFDGNGHVVYGLYTETDVDMSFAGLIPVIGEGAVIKNVGVSNAYISNNYGGGSTYAAAITSYVAKYNDGGRMPVVSGCFADSTVTVEANYAGGIVGGVPSPVKIENCFFTGKLLGRTHRGAIIGNIWSTGSHILTTYALTADLDGVIGGKMLNYASTDENLYCRNVYCFASTFYGGTEQISFPDMHGNAAKTAMKGFDFTNIWKTVDEGTPVLGAFGSDKFSDKSKRYVTISFVTNCEDLKVEPQTIAIGEQIKLPKISRYGYRLVGWFVYRELDVEYPADAYPISDMLLYAKWEIASIKQDFENYPSTKYDMGSDFVYFRPGAQGYDSNKVYEGASALHRIGSESAEADFLLMYEQELEVGREYEMTYRVYTDSDSANLALSLVHLTWPDIAAPSVKVESMITEVLEGNNWKEYTFKFTAQSKWVSIRTGGGASLFFDYFVLVPTENFTENSGLSGNITDSGLSLWMIITIVAVSATTLAVVAVVVIHFVKRKVNK